jgi:Zn-dependent protease with chaperone function
MGFRAVAAMAVVALVVLAWHHLRTRPWRGSLKATVGLLLLPAGLLAVADAYTVYLYAHGCLAPAGGVWRAVGLLVLAAANGALALSALAAWRRAAGIERVLAGLPRLDAPTAARLASALPGLKDVTLRVCPADTPVLFTAGKRRPTIVVSRWVLAHLDDQELTSALAHELGHIAHGDSRLLTLVHALCPGGLGLFEAQLRHLSADLEQRADAWAAAHTADRLALASALVKVSRFSIPAERAYAPAFAGQSSAVQARVQTLLTGPTAPKASPAAWWPVAALVAGSLFLALQAVSRLCGVSAG